MSTPNSSLAETIALLSGMAKGCEPVMGKPRPHSEVS